MTRDPVFNYPKVPYLELELKLELELVLTLFAASAAAAARRPGGPGEVGEVGVGGQIWGPGGHGRGGTVKALAGL